MKRRLAKSQSHRVESVVCQKERTANFCATVTFKILAMFDFLGKFGEFKGQIVMGAITILDGFPPRSAIGDAAVSRLK